jgi:hypothetical protein
MIMDYMARTPFVLGTSSPPVCVIAMRIANARALKADSALGISAQHGMLGSHVMIVLASYIVDVKGDTSSKCE